jgi:ACS family hexuronate transporter-like MFS transporter
MKSDPDSGWRWSVCGLLLLATMLNYMDRQTLSQLATTICTEYGLNNEQYGRLDSGFSYAFAFGALFFGFVVDRMRPYWLYPLVLVGWSLAGIATAHAARIGALLLGDDASASEQAYAGFMACRVTLGFFESGHWPCALVTTQAILHRKDRSFGNSILQSGAALGAIFTPLVVLALRRDEPGGWQDPFVIIGYTGMLWIIPWLLLLRNADLSRQSAADAANQDDADSQSTADLVRMFAVLVVVVIAINLTWQYYRVWLPKLLEEQHGYTKQQVGWFTSAYYVATDVGCIAVGFAVKWLTQRGWEVHAARVWTFTICSGLTLLGVLVALLPASPLLLGLLLLIGAGALGLFPNYYAFTQELTRRHQGKIAGMLGTIAWIGNAQLQKFVGANIDSTDSHATSIRIAALAPVVACATLWIFWRPRQTEKSK